MHILVIFSFVYGSLQKENEDLKKPLDPKVYIPFYIKNDKLWDVTRQRGLAQDSKLWGSAWEIHGETSGR